jgi:hypothetical protein
VTPLGSRVDSCGHVWRESARHCPADYDGHSWRESAHRCRVAVGTLLTWICLIGGAAMIMVVGECLVALGILHH